MADELIAFIAAVNKVQSLSDGGIRVTLDLPETAVPQAALLMECQRLGLPLAIDCKTVENKNGVRKGQKRKSKRTTP
jgi:hypothetical protein